MQNAAHRNFTPPLTMYVSCADIIVASCYLPIERNTSNRPIFYFVLIAKRIAHIFSHTSELASASCAVHGKRMNRAKR